MLTATLLSRVYYSEQIEVVKNMLRSLLKGLNVEIHELETTKRGWLRISFSGEDENAALSLLERDIGLCADKLDKFLTIKAYVTRLDRNGLVLNPGVVFPGDLEAVIPLQQLQAQLVDGRKVAIEKIRELYGLCENMPLTIKIISVGESQAGAMLAERQLRIFRFWTKSLLDRVIVLGASESQIQRALKNAGCQNDIVGIEALGLLEYAIACKFGTDAVGLIPKIGKHLSIAGLTVFNPRKIIEFLNYATLKYWQ